MINELVFATRFNALWGSLAPRMEHLVRTVNLSLYERYDTPVESNVENVLRGFASEAAFIAFGTYQNGGTGKTIDLVVDEDWVSIRDRANSRVSGMRGSALTYHGSERKVKSEVLALAKSIIRYVDIVERTNNIRVNPSIPGAGYIDQCEADLICGDTLVEIKNVERTFRATDFRQVLTYLALSFGAEKWSVTSCALVNARRGIYWKDSVDNLAELCSGQSSYGLLESILYSVASGDISR